MLVTSGGIGSPRLLLLSGIGPADHLRQVGVDGRPRPAGRRRATCRTISTSTRWPSARGDYTYDSYVKLAPDACGRASSTSCSGAGRWRRPCSRPAASGTPTGSRRSARHPVPSRPRLGHRGRRREAEERRPDAQLRLPAAALARHGPARQRRSRRGAADRPQLLGRPLRPAACRSQGLRHGARDPAASRRCGPSSWPSACPARSSTRRGSWPTTPSAPARPTIIRSAPARWGRARWRWSTRTCGCAASTACGCATPRSCRACHSSNTNAPTIMVGEKAADLVLGNRAFAPQLEHAA